MGCERLWKHYPGLQTNGERSGDHHHPWGLTFNHAVPNPHDGSVAAFFVTNVADATIDRIEIIPSQSPSTFSVSQIGQLTRSGPETKIAVTWAPSLRLHGTMYSDVLLAIDGAANRIAAYPDSGTRNVATTSMTDKGITAFQGTPLNSPIGLTLNPRGGDLLVVNQNDNHLIELNLPQHKVVGIRSLDNVPVDAQTGNGSALIGAAASTDAMGNLEVFFTDDNTNTLDVLIATPFLCGKIKEKSMWKGMKITHGTPNHKSGLTSVGR
jgi:hypothetical protein